MFDSVTADANSDNRLLHRTTMPAVRAKTGVLFLRCTEEEAAEIRRAAKLEHRTVSAYILNVVLSRIDAREKLLLEYAGQPWKQSRKFTLKQFLS